MSHKTYIEESKKLKDLGRILFLIYNNASTISTYLLDLIIKPNYEIADKLEMIVHCACAGG